MSEDARQPPGTANPVAIRITRPFATEDELLQHEADTLTRTGVTLLGAQPRPQGVVLRFELALATGAAVLRGEGRVVGYKSNVHEGLGGLTLRFTRLDSRSKSLVDKAAALRDQRRQSMPPPLQAPQASVRPPPPTPPSDSSITVEMADASAPSLPAPSSTPELSNPPSVPPPAMAPALSAPPQPPPLAPPALAPPVVPLRPAVAFPLPPAARSLEAPPSREDLLGRLRSRARALDASQVARILERK